MSTLTNILKGPGANGSDPQVPGAHGSGYQHQNSRAQPLLLFVACLLLSLIYCPPVDLFFDDKEIFRYAGLLIYKGGVPYRDLFDHKPPLIFFLNYLGLLLGPWGLWLIDTFLVTLASLLFFRTCRRYRLAFPWLLPLLFNLLIRNYLACVGIGMTRAYTAIFLLLLFVVLMDRPRFTWFWLGILTALTFFMQQDQILPLLPFLAYALLSRSSAPPAPGTPSFLRWTQFLTGLACITAIILFYFGMHHALPAFWEDAFAFNFSWYTEKRPFIEHFRAIKDGLEKSSYEMPLIIATSLGGCALLLRDTKKKLLIAALLSTILAFGPEYLSGKLEAGHAFYYYFLPLSATLPILVFTVFAFTRESFLSDKKSQALFGFLLCCLPLYNALQHASHLSFHNRDIIETTPEFNYLRQQPFAKQHEDYQLYIFGDNNWVLAYNRFRILAPSHWIYHHFWEWYGGWDAGHRQLEGIKSDLLRHRTKYIIDYSPLVRWRDSTARDSWNAFLRQYYQPLSLTGSTSRFLFWQRLDTLAPRPLPQ